MRRTVAVDNSKTFYDGHVVNELSLEINGSVHVHVCVSDCVVHFVFPDGSWDHLGPIELWCSTWSALFRG